MDRTEVMICQGLYCPGIRKSIWKEGTNCENCQHTEQSNKRYGKLSAKEAEEIPWNKLCVDLIGPYVIIRRLNKENLNLKAITMIYFVTGWF